MKTVIEMAKEAGFPFNKFGLLQSDDNCEIDADQMLERLVELARADERAMLAEQPAPAEGTLAQEVIGCFNAALSEGLQEALDETTDEHLKDLVERRFMYALYAAQDTTPQAQPAPEIAIADAYRAGVDSGIAAEREACAQVCDELAETEWADNERCAAAIRARSNT